MADTILSSNECASILGIASTLPWKANKIVTDNRNVTPGSLFVAIIGERVDGHTFLHDVHKRGASAALVSRIPEDAPKELPMLCVEDVLAALRALALYKRNQGSTRFVGVTGSVAKTSTKEMLATALSSFNTAITPGNANSQVGLPVAMLNMQDDAEFSVFEMAMDGPGQISRLTKIVQPEVSIITTIEPMHIEHLGSMEAIADAKSEIMEGMKEGSSMILPGDNPYFPRLLAAAKRHKLKPVTFGQKEGVDARLLSYEWNGGKATVSALIHNKKLTFTLTTPGKHHAQNAVASLAAVDALGLNVEEAASCLIRFNPIQGRGQIHHVMFEGKAITLIDESYNAGLLAMKATIENAANLRKNNQKLITILGDMRELGDLEESSHLELAEVVAGFGVDLCVGIGQSIKKTTDALANNVETRYYPAVDAFIPECSKIMSAVEDGDVVLVKASRSLGLDKVVTYLLEHQQEPSY